MVKVLSGEVAIKLILVRHAQTAWNREHLVQGSHSDTELDETGRSQAHKLAQALSETYREGAGVKAIYSSPQKRALHTAQALAQRLGLGLIVEPALQEIDTGQADGLPVAQLEEKHPQFWREWVEGANSLRWPGGESLEEVGVRTAGLLSRLQGQLEPGGPVPPPQGEAVVLVGHTFSLLILLLQALGLELGLFRRLRLEVASISVVELGARGATLLRLNDTCHWKEG